MARIFITGSADGLGRAAADILLGDRHDVIVHARSAERLANINALLARGASAIVGDLSDLDQTRAVADQDNRLEPVDAVIHNAGVLNGRHVLPVNVVAPYLLTALVRAERLVYLSSDMHHSGRPGIAGRTGEANARPTRTPTASYSSPPSPSRWPDSGRTCTATPSTPAGADQDRRPGSPRRPPVGTPDPGVARHQQRTRGPHQRRILVPQATPQSTPGGPRRGVPTRAPHRLGALHRHAADLSRSDCCLSVQGRPCQGA
jgi:hypothetical protein